MIKKCVNTRPNSPSLNDRILVPHVLVQGILLGFLCLGCFSAAGCNASRYSERFGLGTIERQKSKAAEFDPYPLNDIGPSVVGGRPPGFFNPLPEPRRNELMGRNPTYGASPATR